MSIPARQIVLFGDSILDNGAYTRPEPDTTAHLQEMLTAWSVRRLAHDGATMGHVGLQLSELDARPDIAVLSVGGNDATEHIGLLERRASSAAEVLDDLLRIADEFADRYEPVARAVRDRVERLVVCTIYEVPLQPPRYARLACVPLALLNDRIIRIAAGLRVDVLDLRSVCTEPSDFFQQIEPSAQGAAKIAGAIAGLVDVEVPRTSRLFGASATR